jgi:spore maturation protein CgeB
VDLTKIRPRHVISPAFWQRGFYSVRELARARNQSAPATPDIEELYAPDETAKPVRPALRILFAAPRYDYGDPRRGEGIEEFYFLRTLVAMGYRVVRFDSLELIRKYGKAAMNRMLLDSVDHYKPDLLMTVLFKEEFEPAVIARLTRELRGRTFNWFCDDQWRFDAFSRRWAGNFGWVVTTSHAAEQRYHAAGLDNVIVSQWGCNHFVYRPQPVAKCFDVSFVGQPHGDRPRIVAALRRAGIDVSVWGFGWPAGRISQEEMIRVFSASRINLNLSNASVGKEDQVKGRDFEVPGCGGFMITKYSTELASCYEPGVEVETYRDLDGLVETIRHYLTDAERREQIAVRGYERTIREHTMESRLSSILATVASAPPNQEKYPAGLREGIGGRETRSTM